MKLLILLPLAAANLAAQAPWSDPKTPRSPSVGVEKSYEALPVKNGQTAVTDLAVPPEAVAPPRQLADQAVADVVTSSIASVFGNPDFVAIDEPGDGSIWAVGRNYKAAFDADGWRFIGQPAPEAPGASPIAFHLEKVTLGDAVVALGSPERRRNERHVEYRYGGVIEAIDIANGGVEQTFTFTTLPARGELVLEIAATTALSGENHDDGVLFRGAFDEVGYSQAVAIDANGRSIAAPTVFADGKVKIRVPAAFIANAALPLVVDPWIHAVQVYPSTNDVGDPDIAWDETGQVWGVAFMRIFAAGDWDCYVQRVSFGNPMTLVGSLTTIDASSTSWQRPRIANLGAYDEFMVVAQTKSGTTPWRVQGRIMGNSGSIATGQFVIASSSVDELHPDIGGDAALPPTYFTVVWEHNYSATDHDIYARQVDASGNLRGTGNTFVQTNTLNQTWPTISKSDGGIPYSTQRFAIAYQQTFSAGDQDIYGAMLTWDGVFVPVNGSNTFAIQTSGFNDTFPQVSSPTLPGSSPSRLMLAVYERTNSNAGDIVGTCFDHAGLVRASANINELEQSVQRLSWPQYRPSVDSDGMRFVVGYHEVYNGNLVINDLDTRATVVALSGSALITEEAGTALAFSGSSREFNLQIAARYSGLGSYSRHFNTCNDRDGISGGGFGIDAYSFDAVPQGRFVTRFTACGSLGISASGQAIPGGVISLSLTAQPFISGFVLGQATSSPVGLCPGCTLGVSGFLSLGPNYGVAVPVDASLVGVQFSAQGFVFQPSGAPCIGQIQLSNTIDITVE